LSSVGPYNTKGSPGEPSFQNDDSFLVRDETKRLTALEDPSNLNLGGTQLVGPHATETLAEERRSSLSGHTSGLSDPGRNRQVLTKRLKTTPQPIGLVSFKPKLFDVLYRAGAENNLTMCRGLSTIMRLHEATLEACMAIDRDGDGLLSAADLRHIVTSIDESCGHDDNDHIFYLLEQDGKGRIACGLSESQSIY